MRYLPMIKIVATHPKGRTSTNIFEMRLIIAGKKEEGQIKKTRGIFSGPVLILAN
jgi:hypothetical protein